MTSNETKTQLITAVHEQLQDCTEVFLALADPVRQEIIMVLTKYDTLNVTQIVEQFSLSRPTISHHLKILRQAGLVSTQKVATEIFYTLQIQDALKNLKKLVDISEEIEDSKQICE
ncbi:ArsR/SmtB family transcription factor [Chengkuizengella axinellae]|uniref:Metalloregulator ArsR/SmtB family transcription factor n=1 Tax=Chengkuizengella axinellae TaxID=3064388 RepID=A0ABT9J006_9BACL|nr:metalloregulator ArsR/SmtB family transcription factor [Chengkuizengella sp. 2205SS18-9]MDP5274908.1 metalloregulator ArsR/SmtB family transcription factor [Chengkuizengella sp. 2205SS18-9]